MNAFTGAFGVGVEQSFRISLPPLEANQAKYGSITHLCWNEIMKHSWILLYFKPDIDLILVSHSRETESATFSSLYPSLGFLRSFIHPSLSSTLSDNPIIMQANPTFSPLDADTSQTLLFHLNNSISPESHAREAALAWLQACEGLPGFLYSLVEVVGARELPITVRTQAVLYFKNCLDKYWRRGKQ
jgi:hypothetical protein